MKRNGLVLLLLLPILQLAAQRIRTIVPTQPVIAGTAFQVQYVVSDPSALLDFSPPQFDRLKIVSGPNRYKGMVASGGKQQAIENITYTLVPESIGRITIHGLHARFRNAPDEQAGDASVLVVAQPKASFSISNSYTDAQLYAPSSRNDLEKLIRDNFFIRTDVSKKTCFVGEPVMVTYTLYSRLQSSSEAIRSPAFYGFSVVDMVDINRAHLGIDTVGNRIFNTSVLRQVQLYPTAAGDFRIDEMYLQNQIVFNDSVGPGKQVINRELVSQPVMITVRPLPGTHPDDFTGAVGSFGLSAAIYQNKAGDEGKLVVTIKGKGNFLQFGPPAVQWPAGIGSLEPVITDTLESKLLPVAGTRKMVFGFTCDSAGFYQIPPVHFSYFDPAVKEFRMLTAGPFDLKVAKRNSAGVQASPGKGSRSPLQLILFIFLIMVAAVIILLRKKKIKEQPPVIPEQPRKNYEDLIAEVKTEEGREGEACRQIVRILGEWMLEKKIVLSGEQRRELEGIRRDCQMTAYSGLTSGITSEALKKRSLQLVRDAARDHSAYL
jgi:hypothetical protein